MDFSRDNFFENDKINNVKGHSNPLEGFLSMLNYLSWFLFILSLLLAMILLDAKFLKLTLISAGMIFGSFILLGISRGIEKEKRLYISCNDSQIMAEEAGSGYFAKAKAYKAASFGTYTKSLTIHSCEKCSFRCRHLNFYDRDSDTVRIKNYLENHGIPVKEYNDKPDNDD